ncbi:hypothetical protein OIU77_010176 [Salix suchowensis]|uniref:Leucine-rich repeat-containing N-terminal plant-type domain-containing protein n=1 Tax=Salix suchowensis TaxID=1278906 RepID=A0ABQ9A8E0_9ROSI|nr:hypothetical protein OIU77_010176 [Salix suchowensis]
MVKRMLESLLISMPLLYPHFVENRFTQCYFLILPCPPSVYGYGSLDSILLSAKQDVVVFGKALMSIKKSFSNEANVLLDWDDVHNEDFCSWRGVFCENVSFSVVSLNLSNLNLGGEISPAIGDLIDFLVDLSDNLLYGDIPFSISRLKRLDTLNLKSNQLTGPIPSTLTQLPNLKTL